MSSGNKKIRDTKLGIWLKEKAPNILDTVGDLLPDKGIGNPVLIVLVYGLPDRRIAFTHETHGLSPGFVVKLKAAASVQQMRREVVTLIEWRASPGRERDEFAGKFVVSDGPG